METDCEISQKGRHINVLCIPLFLYHPFIKALSLCYTTLSHWPHDIPRPSWHGMAQCLNIRRLGEYLWRPSINQDLFCVAPNMKTNSREEVFTGFNLTHSHLSICVRWSPHAVAVGAGQAPRCLREAQIGIKIFASSGHCVVFISFTYDIMIRVHLSPYREHRFSLTSHAC